MKATVNAISQYLLRFFLIFFMFFQVFGLASLIAKAKILDKQWLIYIKKLLINNM